jgi:hypothetical protein
MAPHYRVQVRIVVCTMLRREQGTLRGSTTSRHARIWWDHYYAMQPAGHVVTWDEFWTAFSMHRLSITCASTRVIMRTLTPVNGIAFVEA